MINFSQHEDHETESAENEAEKEADDAPDDVSLFGSVHICVLCYIHGCREEPMMGFNTY